MSHKKRNKSTLSLCMIVKDEENYLEVSLKSILPIVDEIIIVDTGSKDRTPEIAKKYGAKFFAFKWCEDFSAARNFSLSKATCEKILVLDADETISERDLPEMVELLYAGKDISYSFVTRNYTDLWAEANWRPVDGVYEKESKMAYGWIPSEKVRLFPNDRKIFFSGRIHETADASIFKINGKILKCNIPIHNYGYIREDRSYSEKKSQYLKIMEKFFFTNPSPKVLKDASLIYKSYGAFEKAVTTLKKALSIDPHNWETYAYLASTYAEQGKNSLAMEYYHRAIQIHPYDAQLHNNLGVLYKEMGKENEAISEWEKALGIDPNYINSNLNLATYYSKHQEYNKAIDLYKNVLKIHPNNIKALINLGFIYDQLGKYSDAAICYCKVFEVDQQNAEAHNNLGVVLCKLHMNDEAIKEFELSIKHRFSWQLMITKIRL